MAKGMKRIDPAKFQGPRAYYTDFDPKIVRYKHDKKAYRKEVERRLKITLLTKNNVVCAASHMTGEFAYGLFKDNPILLTEKMIMPALREDKEHVIAYIEDRRIRQSLKDPMKNFYQTNVDEVVNWRLTENAAWFREKLLAAISNEASVIRRNLADLPKLKLGSLTSELRKSAIVSRELILKGISTWPPKQQRIVLNFVNLVYHMSGARVVNCESTLPQENYVDYSLTDFSEHRMVLSDTQVFQKIFFELAFETLYRDAFRVEFLDMLSFEDISHLRKPLHSSTFRQKYDELVQTSVESAVNPKASLDEAAYDIQKPLKLLEQISKTFEQIFRQELPEFMKKKRKGRTKELQKSTLSIGLGIAGLVPPISIVATPLSLICGSRDLLVNLNQFIKGREGMKDYTTYIKYKEKLLHQMIDKYRISEKSTLLDALDLITNSIATRMIL